MLVSEVSDQISGMAKDVGGIETIVSYLLPFISMCEGAICLFDETAALSGCQSGGERYDGKRGGGCEEEASKGEGCV